MLERELEVGLDLSEQLVLVDGRARQDDALVAAEHAAALHLALQVVLACTHTNTTTQLTC